MLIPECAVTRISQSDYNIDNGAEPIIFPYGLKVGMSITPEELIKLVGEPDKVHEYKSDSSDYWSNTYCWCQDKTWTTTNNFEIEISNDIITDIELDHRYPES